MKNREHSEAYQYLIDQVNAKGSQKLSGYYPNIMEEIYGWERREVEDIVWKTFHNKDISIAMFLPKLKRYKGIDALKKMLNNYPNNLTISKVLYDYTGEKKYLEAIRQIIFSSKGDEDLSAVSTLLSCKPSDDVFNIFVEVYLTTEDKTILVTTAKGMLYNKGYFIDPHGIKEFQEKIELIRAFMNKSKEERKEMVEKLINGDI